MSTRTAPGKRPRTQGTVMVYKGSEEFSSWLVDLSDSVRLPATNTVDQALREFAERRGFRPMPSRTARQSPRRARRPQPAPGA